MGKASKVMRGVVLLALLALIAVAILWMTRPSPAPPLALRFERYSKRSDFFDQTMAFFWITNASEKTYWVPMLGGTNTSQSDGIIGASRFNGSYMFITEFSGEPTRPINVMTWGQSMGLKPHSALRLRVALTPESRDQQVAVLCAEMPTGPRPFWTNGIGRAVVRLVPRSFAHKLLWKPPTVTKVWCDEKLSSPAQKN